MKTFVWIKVLYTLFSIRKERRRGKRRTLEFDIEEFKLCLTQGSPAAQPSGCLVGADNFRGCHVAASGDVPSVCTTAPHANNKD